MPMTLNEVQPAADVQSRGTQPPTAPGGLYHSRGCKPVAFGLLDSPCMGTMANSTVGEFMIFKNPSCWLFFPKIRS